ncbi:MAG: dCMP deaminase family protein [Magnetococcales bacterium]|nr:dCMP deaminase family protein [Magnetococcales bacterium]MBF0440193.1 dCMP deaminase family protein [Magnetococcales bacterium]
MSETAGRPSWDRHWMDAARLAAQMSTCVSGRKVGAVFVRDKRLLATGFNGVPSGYPHPEVCFRRQTGVPSGQGLDLCVCAHAEANGIANAARHGVSLEGAKVYVTCQPCAACMGMLANVGIKHVVFGGLYPDERSQAIADYAGIELIGLPEDQR